jgi:hypothetical protein
MIFIGLASWYIHNDMSKHLNEPSYKYHDGIIDNLNKTIHELKNKVDKQLENKIEKHLKKKIDNNLENNIISNDIERKLYLNNRDKDVLYNDFAPPERRPQEYSYPYNYMKQKMNISTRGLPDNYHLIGVLLRNNTESAFNLFGRQTFPGSNQWEYYVQGIMKDTPIKIPIKIRGNKEIEDGENIIVPGSDLSKGTYKVKLYDYDVIRYNPYI